MQHISLSSDKVTSIDNDDKYSSGILQNSFDVASRTFVMRCDAQLYLWGRHDGLRDRSNWLLYRRYARSALLGEKYALEGEENAHDVRRSWAVSRFDILSRNKREEPANVHLFTTSGLIPDV